MTCQGFRVRDPGWEAVCADRGHLMGSRSLPSAGVSTAGGTRTASWVGGNPVRTRV